MEIRRRNYLQKLINHMDNNLVKVITGIRRSGKSFLLFKIFNNYLESVGVKKSQIISLELDMLENVKYRNAFVILDYIKSKVTSNEKFYIFLDEVQLLDKFEEVLNSLLHYHLLRNATRNRLVIYIFLWGNLYLICTKN